jgi:alpha-galactosidase
MMFENIQNNRLADLFNGFTAFDGGLAWINGLFLIDTTQKRYEADDWILEHHDSSEKKSKLQFVSADKALQIESSWGYDPEKAIWSRKDCLRNIGSEAVVVSKAFSRFSFSPGHYEIYSQESRWCNENQGLWQSIDHGITVLRCEQGRTCQGGTPYLFLRNNETNKGLAFHLLPLGNWEIRVAACPSGNDVLPAIKIELGICSEDLKMSVSPGQEIELSEIIIQSSDSGDPAEVSANLHRYLLKHHFKTAKPFAPVVYNTWFDVFECLDVERLRKELDAAKKIGCEVFVIDAGWYGQGDGDWGSQTGDWREKLTDAFKGRMKEFSDEVRSRGLGFGLWMEPERICENVPIRKEHPEWFIKGTSGYYPDLCQKEVYQYIYSEMSRLIETYGLVWMKEDFNNHLGIDPSGTEFYRYYEAWYRLVDELRAKYPQVFLEACASGGLRSDINTLMYFDGHFLSDTVQPVDTIRLAEGACLRLPPGRMTKWVALRSAGKTIPQYGLPVESCPQRFVAPGSAVWEDNFIVDLDFAVRACEVGMMGFTGDLASLPEEAIQKLALHVEWFKRHREFITGSAAYLLTQPERKDNRSGWSAIQLQQPENDESLLFVYRLNDSRGTYRLILRNLNMSKKYNVLNIDTNESTRYDGETLMKKGLDVMLPKRHSAAVYAIKQVEQ